MKTCLIFKRLAHNNIYEIINKELKNNKNHEKNKTPFYTENFFQIFVKILKSNTCENSKNFNEKL